MNLHDLSVIDAMKYFIEAKWLQAAVFLTILSILTVPLIFKIQEKSNELFGPKCKHLIFIFENKSLNLKSKNKFMKYLLITLVG